ncbi:hypothetical protein HNP48_006368 [Acidovorax soli]|uniref:Uncharacterized protein n=1 Tax=Acidovorax soli TaxID=592050 RepID=A0A7X0PL72_9BURK|nr:hypothetical protein [Acidovorax soli]MBB6563644.1 hypothetical protein [Acidovorax soli]
MPSAVPTLALVLTAWCVLLAFWLWRHPQEWAALGANRRQRCKALPRARPLVVWIGLPCLCLALAALASHRAGLAEAWEQALCGPPCPALPAEALRVQAIRSYLHILLDLRTPASDGWGYDQLLLLPAQLDAQDLVQGLHDMTLLGTLTTGAQALATHAAIEALPADALASHPTVVGLSRAHYTALVVPLASMQPLSPQGLNGVAGATPGSLAHPRIGRWERLRGYGRHFFTLTEYRDLDLSCCDGRPTSTSGRQRRQYGLDYIAAARSQLIAVSDQGQVLRWHDDLGETSGVSYRLLPHGGQGLPRGGED